MVVWGWRAGAKPAAAAKKKEKKEGCRSREDEK
jgi:hypothetical protein